MTPSFGLASRWGSEDTILAAVGSERLWDGRAEEAYDEVVELIEEVEVVSGDELGCLSRAALCRCEV
jgi:hypothetical protein